jgi:PAS domain S-box-containing protein
MKDRDKTKEQLIEELAELRLREAKWRSVAENTPLFVAVVDQSGKIEFHNRFQPGFTPETVLGRPIYDFLQPESHAIARHCLEHVFQTGEGASYESVGAGPDGSVANYVADVGPVIVDGEIVAATLIARDITERKRAEEKLRESEKGFRSLFQDSSVGTAVTSPTGEFFQVNRAFCEFVGYSEPELVGKSVLFVTHSDDREISTQVIHQAAHAGPPILRFEKRYLHKSGRVVWGEASSNLMFDADGRPDYFITQVLDITDRRRAEEALKVAHDELEAKVKERTAELSTANEQLRVFRMFAEASGQAFAMAGFDHRITYANPAMLRLCGEEKIEDVLGKNFLVYYPGELRERLEEQMLSGVQQKGHWAGKLKFVATTGEPRIVYSDAFHIRNDAGEPLVLAVVMTDITELQKAQEALAESEKKYRLLIETTGTGYVILDGQGRIIDANSEYLRISGHRTLEEILGRTVVEWTASYDVDRNAKEVEKCYRKGFVRQLEIDHVNSDGKIIPIDINATCLDTEDGRRIVCLCRDITERRQAQEALERERQSLWRMIQANDHERQLVAYDIHDGLAQYLAGANMQLQVFDGLRESNPEEAKKAYDAAKQLVRQAHSESRRLISEVRPPVIDEIGLETAISHLVHEQRKHGGPKIECHSSVQFDRLPSILENGIYRIVQEALTNACRHSKSKKATVTMNQEGHDVRLEVRDWGIGFDPQAVEKGHFGLDGIRQRVRLLGGRLTIESTPGSGTLVRVVVPIVERQNEG